jgi:predicted DNA-binding protein
MPRYSNDPKETTVKLRMNDDMREYLEKSAKRKGISMSEYLRNLIIRDMETKKQKRRL